MRHGTSASCSASQTNFASVSRVAFASMFVTTAAACAAAQDFNSAPPNAADQQPAFQGQTRAPVISDDTQLVSTVVAEGLENPWGMAELPDGQWLVTERPGRLRLVRPDGTVSEPIQGVSEVVARGARRVARCGRSR